MSAAFRSNSYQVVAADIMTFATQHARVRLHFNSPPMFEGLGLQYSEVLDLLNKCEPVEGLFAREYGPAGTPVAGFAPRKYLTDANARKVDGIRNLIAEIAPKLSLDEESLLRHDLVLAVNRVANIAGTYGHFRSTWSSSSVRPIFLRPTVFEAGNIEGHQVLQGPVEEIASEIAADACYLDPPYMKRQYAANYHLLETLARGDEPVPVGVSGLRDWWDQYSDFCSKRKIADAFAAAITKMDCPKFFISYSEDGLLTREQLSALLGDFGTVECHEFDYKRFRSNTGGAGGLVKELLFVVDKHH